ncbi:MAG: sugar transferase [Candidatus Aminicenantales bacterium]|jgi:exopolysaccharide biosynthesis polyprenyl glycosylphosphotransferase
MLWRPPSHKRLLQIADGLTTVGSAILAYLVWDLFRLKTGIPHPITISRYTYWLVLGLSIVWVILLSLQQAYSYQRLTSLKREMKIVIKTAIYGIIALMLANFLLRFGHLPRTFVAVFGGINIGCLSIEKIILFYAARMLRKKGINRRSILIIGTGKEAERFIEIVKGNFGPGINIIGFVRTDAKDAPETKYNKKVLGNVSQIETILHENIIDEIVICSSDGNIEKVKETLESCGREGVQVRLYSDFLSGIAKKIRVDDFYGINIISFISVPDDEMALYAKRASDLFLSGILLILLSPLFLIISALIKVTSKGPIFYRWNVVGLNKKPFISWKFRTMIPNADEQKKDLMERNEMTGPVFKIKDDPRINRIGRILRKFSLDELPQLWSVFKGDMSMVGPRPAGPHELARYENWHRKKLSIKPGITCLWQVSGRNQIKDFNEWVRLDLAYIENWSLGLDLKILLRTIPAVLRGTGA